MKENCIVTVATYRWLPRALVMAESALKYNANCDIIILIPDMSHKKIEDIIYPVSSSVQIIGFDDIENPIFKNLRVYFNIFELCCAAKSFLIEHSIFTKGYSKVVYLDADIICYNSLNEIWLILEQNDVLVTPHVNSPLPLDANLPDDRELINLGFINGGFCAVAKTYGARKCLDWLIEKVTHFGFYAPHINLNADQTWMSCLPWFFPDSTTIIRNSGMNVAYWNLHERHLFKKNREYFCDDENLVFFHFSGYNEKNPDRLTMHTNRTFDINTEKIVLELIEDYKNQLAKATKSLPQIEPDISCCDLLIEKRIELYQNVYGKKVIFHAELECVSVINKLLNKLKKTINSLSTRFFNTNSSY